MGRSWTQRTYVPVVGGGSVERIGAGQETSYWVQLKAPPEDVGAISIDFSGGASIDNVPIAP